MSRWTWSSAAACTSTWTSTGPPSGWRTTEPGLLLALPHGRRPAGDSPGSRWPPGWSHRCSRRCRWSSTPRGPTTTADAVTWVGVGVPVEGPGQRARARQDRPPASGASRVVAGAVGARRRAAERVDLGIRRWVTGSTAVATGAGTGGADRADVAETGSGGLAALPVDAPALALGGAAPDRPRAPGGPVRARGRPRVRAHWSQMAFASSASSSETG